MPEFQSHASAFWDERYRDETFIYGESPNEYLAAQRERFRPGMRALVPGDGEGRNGVWLAEQGLDVVTVDLSEAGVNKARKLAAKRGVRITAIQADLTQWAWPVAEFDVVAAIFLHLPPEIRQPIHRAMLAALRPGGLLVIEAYRPEQVQYREKYGSKGGPPGAEMMFTEAMLREDFAEAEEIELASGDVDLSEGTHHRGLGAVVHGVFRGEELETAERPRAAHAGATQLRIERQDAAVDERQGKREGDVATNDTTQNECSARRSFIRDHSCAFVADFLCSSLAFLATWRLGVHNEMRRDCLTPSAPATPPPSRRPARRRP